MSRKAWKFKGFSAQNQVISKKKKKKKKVFAKIHSDFSAEIRNSKVFSAQNQMISEKKKVFPKLSLKFLPISQIQTFEGGLFSIFHIKSASKPQKTCDFAYFTTQWGGARAPPAPPLATLLLVNETIIFILLQKWQQ